MTKGLVLTCDPRFVSELKKELQLPKEPDELLVLAPGVLFVARETVGEAIFLRHQFSVQQVVALESAAFDLLRLAGAAELLLAAEKAGTRVAVQCRIMDRACPYQARDVKGALDGVLPLHGLWPETKHPSLVLSVLIAKQRAYLGVSSPSENLSRWNGGAAHYGKLSGALSRAEHKLEEAFEVFGIELAASAQVLDLGAAPGGWTSFLLKQGHYVTAVDTGELARELLTHPRLIYHRQNAWHIKPPAATFDLITCDMGREASGTVEVLLHLASSLKSGGALLMTVKFMGHEPLPLIRECRRKLEQRYRMRAGRHLWHNREEVTLYLVRHA